MSTTISPVTHTALVDVNRASMKDRSLLSEMGSINNIVPPRINIIKLNIKSWVGVKVDRFK
ncbi:conserved hypothetical protein [Sphingobacterium sp. PM2-P1-29]|nr:conserved hypothetical protein [Sphingobacterium sp. PM2-P1-29]